MILSVVSGVLIATAIMSLLLAVGRVMEPVGEVEQRVEYLVRNRYRRGSGAGEGSEGSSGTVLDAVERRISRRSFAEAIRVDLASADLAITVTEYLLIRFAILVVACVAGYLLQRNLLSTLLMGVLGFALPVIYVRQRRGRRLRQFSGQLPDVLDHLVGSLRAGYGLLQAVEWVARQLSKPAGEEFNRVVREVQLGRSLTHSLDSMVRRFDSDDLALIVTAIKIQHEIGGSLADILEIVAETIRERVRIQREIRVLTAQQRYSGYVLMVLPIALGFVLFLISPEYEMRLFDPGPTLCIPIGAGLMMIMGFFIMRRIVNIDV